MNEKTDDGDAGSASPSGITKVSVAIRVRPLIDREQKAGAQAYWQVGEKELRAVNPETKRLNPNGPIFAYDHVFDKTTQTKEVYDRVVAPIVRKSLKGFNGTILCYGQTSSGKTHTLYGSNNDKGIILLFAEHLFTHMQADQGRRQYIIKVGLIEIYNEKVTDLLNSENPIDLVEREGTVVPHGVEEITVFTQEDIIKVAQRIQRERKIGETRMNKESSRSHTILRVTIESFDLSATNLSYNDEANSDQCPALTTSVLHFVDLAGSEKQNQTGAEGVRFQEQININKSLSSLSFVIKQLSDIAAAAPDEGTLVKVMCNSMVRGGPKSQLPSKYINFRDSKLTRLLQSTLNGEACTSMICNVTIASLDETKSTLVFARQAKTINISPKQNLSNKLEYEKKLKELQDMLNGKDKEMSALRKQFENLKQAFQVRSSSQSVINDRRLSHCPPLLSGSAASETDMREWKEESEILETQNQSLKTENLRLSCIAGPMKQLTEETLELENDVVVKQIQVKRRTTEIKAELNSVTAQKDSEISRLKDGKLGLERCMANSKEESAFVTEFIKSQLLDLTTKLAAKDTKNESLKTDDLKMSPSADEIQVEIMERTTVLVVGLVSKISELRDEKLELETHMANYKEVSTKLIKSMNSKLLGLTTKLAANEGKVQSLKTENINMVKNALKYEVDCNLWKMNLQRRTTKIVAQRNSLIEQKDSEISELKDAKLKLLRGFAKQIDEFQVQFHQRIAEIRAELNSVTAQKDSEISRLKDAKLKLERRIANLNEEFTSATESMKSQLLDLTTKLAANRKGSALTVNRESQTDSSSEVLEALKNCRTQNQNESGIQCDLLNELIERSSRGEQGLLPDYIPDVAQLRYDLKTSENKVDILVMELANVRSADNRSPFSHIGSSSSAPKERSIGGVVAKYKRPAGHVPMGYQSHALPVGFGPKLMGTAKLPRFGEPVASSSRCDERNEPSANAQENTAPNKENLVPPPTPGLRNSKVDVQTESNYPAMPLSGSSSLNTREPDEEDEDPLKPEGEFYQLLWNTDETVEKPENQENVPPPKEVYPTPAPGAYGGNEFSQTAEPEDDEDDSLTKANAEYYKFLMEFCDQHYAKAAAADGTKK